MDLNSRMFQLQKVRLGVIKPARPAVIEKRSMMLQEWRRSQTLINLLVISLISACQEPAVWFPILATSL